MAASAASAQSFTATLGYQNTDPKPNNGQLAGARASVNDDWSITGSAACGFNDNFFIRGDVRKLDFDIDVTVETLGNVGIANVDPLVYGISAGFRF